MALTTQVHDGTTDPIVEVDTSYTSGSGRSGHRSVVRVTGSGPSGQTPVTIADGDNVTFGAKADAAAAADTSTASYLALFRRLLQKFPRLGTTGSAVLDAPLYVGGKDSAGNLQPLATEINGQLKSVIANSSGSNVAIPAASNDAISTTVLGLMVASWGVAFNGTAFERLRVSNVFKTVSLSAGTAETTIWTPTSGKKFRLMGFLLTCGAASTLTFKDNTAGTTIFVARGTTDQPIKTPPLGNGILSAAANNLLTVTRGTSCTLDGVVFGTEE